MLASGWIQTWSAWPRVPTWYCYVFAWLLYASSWGEASKSWDAVLSHICSQRLADDLHMSADMHAKEAQGFLSTISNAEVLLDLILSLTNPQLYQCGLEAITKLKADDSSQLHANIRSWPSVYSGIQVISNRITPSHRDKGSAPSTYDLLLSVGTHSNARLSIHDIGSSFTYRPGSIILTCGRVLLHEVAEWGDGERLCFAHYMKDKVHERLSVHRPAWVQLDSYTHHMSEHFLARMTPSSSFRKWYTCRPIT